MNQDRRICPSYPRRGSKRWLLFIVALLAMVLHPRAAWAGSANFARASANASIAATAVVLAHYQDRSQDQEAQAPSQAQKEGPDQGPDEGPKMLAPGVWDGKKIAAIQFRGNRRVESEAMRLELKSEPGKLFARSTLALDIRALWNLGYFSDIRVEGRLEQGEVVLTFVISERPTIRKVIVEGHDRVKLDDINEVLDLVKNEVLDLGKVAANVDKVRNVYAEKGFFLAEVNYAVREVEDEPGRVDVVLLVSEADEVVVREITFVGNKALADKELRGVIFTRVGGFLSLISNKAGGVYNRELFAQDYAILRQYYADKGYHDADFLDAELALSSDRKFVHINIPVREGPRYRISSLGASETLESDEVEPLFDREELQKVVDSTLAVGDVASAGKINELREALELKYKNAGYAYVNVILDARPDRKKRRFAVHFDVQKGPLVYIEKIQIAGNAKTADKVIRREIPIMEGERYSESAKESTRLRVMRLGYFSEVNVSTSRGSADDKIVLNVETIEQLTGSFQVGAGFSSYEGFVFSAQISYNNFLGRGASVQLNANYSALRMQFNLNYYTRYFLDTKWNFILNVFRMRTANYAFDREGTGAEMSWGYPIPGLPNLTGFVGYSIEQVKLNFDRRGGVFGGGLGGGLGGGPGSWGLQIGSQSLVRNILNSSGLTSAAILRLNWEGRDSILFPTRGFYQDIRVEFATPYLGSQNVYNRYSSDTRFYVPVIPSEKSFRAWLVFKSRLQVGWIHNNRPQGVPVAERYNPGGIYGHGGLRGFPAMRLGPHLLAMEDPDPQGIPRAYPIGGNLLTALNVELESMIVPQANIKGLIFMDVGNAFNTEALYCTVPNPELPKKDPCGRFGFKNLRYSAGFGVRWQSPIGPLRFEWGFPLDRLQRTKLIAGEERMQFEFNVGTGF